MEEVETRLYNIRQDKISEDNVYQFLLFFDKLYDKFTDLEKKTFLKSFLSDVFIYEEEQKDGRILKGLRFKFPIYMNGRNVLGVEWDNESTDEMVVLLSQLKQKPDDYINLRVATRRMDCLQGNSTTAATDLELVPSPNLPKNEDSRQPQCPEDKESAIVEALKHFKMNS